MSEPTNMSVATRTSSVPMTVSPFSGIEAFESSQRMARALASSNMIPEVYRGDGNMGNCLIALELSARIGASPLMVMQNLHVIQGRPSWSSPFLISAVNTCGRFSPIRYRIRNLGPKKVKYTYWEGFRPNRIKKDGVVDIVDQGCIAWAKDLASGEELEGPEVTLEMAVLEGWYTKADSKWKTMPDVMIRYRAAAFFSRLYAPEVGMGMQTREESEDIITVDGVEVVAPTATSEASPTTGLAKRTERAPRGSKIVDMPQANAEIVDVAAETSAPAQPPEPEVGNKPVEEAPAKAAVASGLRQRKAPPAATTAPPPPATVKPHIAKITAWMSEQGVQPSELLQALFEYGQLGDEADPGSMQIEKLTAEQVDFAVGNGPALADAIKGARV